MESRKQLRKMLKEDGIIKAPGAYDAWSAKLVEAAGYSCVYMTGYGVSASVLGKPDIGLITLPEMATMAKHMVEAVHIPVVADADTGYGSTLNVVRTVQEYEAAGVAAIQLEDQVMPKRCGHMEGKELVTEEEMVAKLRAAVKARQDPDLVIIARTDARAVLGIEAAIERSRAYIAAGADVIFFEAPQSREEMELINRELKVPMLANMVDNGKTPFLAAEKLRAMGYKLVIYPVVPLYAATKACLDILRELDQRGSTSGLQDRLVDFPTFNRMIGLQEFRALERSFNQPENC